MPRFKLARPSASLAGSEKSRRLAQISRLIEQEEWDRAESQLDLYLQTYPTDVKAHRLLADVAFLTHDFRLNEIEATWLVTNAPGDPENWINWIACATAQHLYALALQRLHLFLEKWPNDPEAANYRENLAEIEEMVNAELDDLRVVGVDRLELAAEGDIVQHLVNCEAYEEAIERGRAAMAERPEFIPLSTTIAEALLEVGRVDEAADEFRRVLKHTRDYVFALDGLIRCNVLMGYMQEAATNARELLQCCASTRPIKCGIALAFAGDYAAVIDLFQSVKPTDDDSRLELMHFAAVAYARTDRLQEAQALWKEILKQDPDRTDVRANLNDSSLPAADRNGAWVFDLEDLLPDRLWPELKRRISSGIANESLPEEVLALMAEFPMLRTITPWILAHGEPADRKTFFYLAAQLQPGDVASDLLTFAGDRFGSDDLRMSAYQFLSESGLLSTSRGYPFWSNGELTSIRIGGHDLSIERWYSFSPEVQAIIDATQSYLDSNNGELAVKGMIEAVALDPKSPVLRNNLAAAYRMCDDEEQFKSIILDLYDDYPDYFFARTNMATIQIEAGNLDAARGLLAPLQEMTNLNVSEFRALCTASMSLALSSDAVSEAEAWIARWEELEPDHEIMLHWKRNINEAKSYRLGSKPNRRKRSQKR